MPVSSAVHIDNSSLSAITRVCDDEICLATFSDRTYDRILPYSQNTSIPCHGSSFPSAKLSTPLVKHKSYGLKGTNRTATMGQNNSTSSRWSKSKKPETLMYRTRVTYREGKARGEEAQV